MNRESKTDGYDTRFTLLDVWPDRWRRGLWPKLAHSSASPQFASHGLQRLHQLSFTTPRHARLHLPLPFSFPLETLPLDLLVSIIFSLLPCSFIFCSLFSSYFQTPPPPFHSTPPQTLLLHLLVFFVFSSVILLLIFFPFPALLLSIHFFCYVILALLSSSCSSLKYSSSFSCQVIPDPLSFSSLKNSFSLSLILFLIFFPSSSNFLKFPFFLSKYSSSFSFLFSCS